jgi:hypothetical protein
VATGAAVTPSGFNEYAFQYTVGSTVTITNALVLTVGDTVVIAGVTPPGYNGTFTVTSVGAGTFSYYAGLAAGTGGTATDTTASGTPQSISAALDITSPLASDYRQ